MADAFTTTCFHLDKYEIRSAGDGRTLAGIAVPFDRPTDIGRMREVFRRGAFAQTINANKPNRVKLYARHADDKQLPLGAAKLLREDPAGLYAELHVSRTKAGDEALSLVEDGALDSFSVGFVPIRSTRSADGTVERREVKLLEISLVPYPAYEDAKVLAIREADHAAEQPMSLAQARHLAARIHADAPQFAPGSLR